MAPETYTSHSLKASRQQARALFAYSMGACLLWLGLQEAALHLL